MKITKIATIAAGQDGAIWNGLLFRFENRGLCHVYDLHREGVPEIAAFALDRSPEFAPHSNSVAFGCRYFDPQDEFPLLYSNIYNNYAGSADRMVGVTCVYRLQRAGEGFASTLVQLIRIGFTEDSHWCSEGVADIRPYGNCAIDREKALYYAFTMRDGEQTTRYFAFDLPQPGAGKPDADLGVPVVELSLEDVRESFDCPYHRFLQGACAHKGMIYSLEGFTADGPNPPAMRIIDPAAKTQLCYEVFGNYGLTLEPELIDFDGETCIYGDCKGNLYTIEF
jgi:hypothetical protein